MPRVPHHVANTASDSTNKKSRKTLGLDAYTTTACQKTYSIGVRLRDSRSKRCSPPMIQPSSVFHRKREPLSDYPVCKDSLTSYRFHFVLRSRRRNSIDRWRHYKFTTIKSRPTARILGFAWEIRWRRSSFPPRNKKGSAAGVIILRGRMLNNPTPIEKSFLFPCQHEECTRKNSRQNHSY